MISRFFIDRPIFAAVLSIALTLMGGLAFVGLPMAQYPQIAPPTIHVQAIYPGANARTVAEAVAAPIEQQVNGVEDMLYMSSQCTNAGNYALTVTFRLGVKLNVAQVRIQNRLQLAMPSLPDVVQRTGIVVRKRSPDLMMVVNLISPDGRYDQLYLSNYATLQVREQLNRLPGVGDVNIFGQRDYSMRVWLHPGKLASRGMTAGDVVRALREQNRQVAAGQIGEPPMDSGIELQYSTRAKGLLVEPEEFEGIVVKAGANGELVRLRDVARVELGAVAQDVACYVDGTPSAGLAVYQAPGTNVLDSADSVYAKMIELRKQFPEGLDYKIVHDTTPFIRESIREVVKALRDATILVALVVLVFLQTWRSTIIPLVAVPVAIVGTFAAMAVVGLSLNNLSLFGLVLSIGIVVDDAIVVVENVERWLEHGLSPRDAARKAMDEVTGPIIAVALVLCAVFVPCAFISGITGQFFRQFAITIAVSTVISAFNSLTLSPALAALLLRPKGERPDLPTRVLDLAFGWFFRLFNRAFAATTRGYARVVGRLLRLSALVLVVYAGLLALTYETFQALPKGFIPQQDKKRLMTNVQLPDSASAERTRAVMARVDAIARTTTGVAHTMGIAGNSLLLGATGSNFGTVFVVLDAFEKRHDPSLHASAILPRLQKRFRDEVKEAEVTVFGAPPVDGLGNVAGFKIQIEDRSDLGAASLQEQVDSLVARAKGVPELGNVFTLFRANTPQLVVDVDRTKCKTLGVPLREVFDGLQIYLGGLNVNQFVRFGRTWQVNVQADAPFRMRPEDLGLLKVRNQDGDVVPLSAVTRVDDASGPLYLFRYNTYPAASVSGAPAPGKSSGEAIKAMEELCRRELPQSSGFEWTEIAYQQILAGNTALLIFALAVVFVFLTLAAQYESWALPVSIVLVVPCCILCSLAGVAVAGQDVNVFTQIGFVVLIGLASKNAILIVEFARQLRTKGVERHEATVEACRLRLRPILMTSFAFVFGVLPLMLATGAGAEMRRALGTAVFSGMLGVTLFGVFLTPVFFHVIDRLGPRR